MALDAAIDWEIRTDGNDGGSWTDLVQAEGNTGVGSTVGGFTAGMVGTYLRMTGGANVVPGDYLITAYSSSTSITVASTFASGGNVTVGEGTIYPNGGGYKRTAGATDYNQQATAQLVLMDVTCSTGSKTTLTSVTGGFTAAMVGSVLYLYGTNFTAGWYEVKTRVDTNNITVDRDAIVDTNGSVGVVHVGGVLGGIGELGFVLNTAAQATSGMRAYVRGGTYLLTGTTVNIKGGPLDLDANQMDTKSFYLKGYATDAANRDAFTGTRPVIDCNDQAPASVIELKGGSSESHVVAYLDVLGDAGTSRAINGIYGNSSSYDRIIDCIVRDCDGTYAFSNAVCVKCYALSCAAVGFYLCVSFSCVSDACEGGYSGGMAIRCIAANGTGSTNGFYGSYPTCFECVSYNNGGDGYDETSARAGVYVNGIGYSNGGYEWDTNNDSILINCAAGDVTSGRINVAPFIDLGNPGALSNTVGDVFTNAGAGLFDLTATAGGGALLRAAGISPYGQTGYPDIGAVQHEDAGGGAIFHSGMDGGLTG